MLPRIALGKLNSVRNLCSIPWTDLIFSACAYRKLDTFFIIEIRQARKAERESSSKDWKSSTKCNFRMDSLPTCLSNNCSKARLAIEVTPWIQLNKCNVPEPSGSSSIRFNFDSISAIRKINLSQSKPHNSKWKVKQNIYARQFSPSIVVLQDTKQSKFSLTNCFFAWVRPLRSVFKARAPASKSAALVSWCTRDRKSFASNFSE